MKKKIISILEKFKTSEQVFMIIIPAVIGLLGGVGAAALKFLIHYFQGLFWGNHTFSASWIFMIIIPAAGAFVVGMIIYFFSSEAKGHGVPEVMEAISLRNGIIRARVVFSKAIASSITIASGGSVGREGPIIQIGSAIGSSLGQLFKISQKRMQTLVGCGAAAGIAAAFNAPIAGAMFSVEIILGDFAISQFSPIVISSVTATVISRAFYGNYPAFQVPKYELVHWLELIPYAILGVIAGLVGILFVKVLYYFEDKFDGVKIPDFYKTAAGGILLGILGISFPQIFGVGYKAMDIALLGNMDLWLLFALIFLKILASSITLGSGSSGGIFAPSLFMGAMTGGFFGNILNKIWPGMTAGPGAYSLVAMGAVVAATTHAPITAILIIFEMTNDYKIILPLMIATILSLVVTKTGKGSIYTLKLMRKGINIHKGREINVLKSMKVKDVMRKSIEIIDPKISINDLSHKFVQSEHNFFYILNNENIISEKISQTELAAIAPEYEHLKDIVVASDIATPNHLIVKEDDRLDYVMKEFAKENIGEIPVVSSEDPTKIVGTIWRIDVISTYNKEILKRDLAGEVSQLIADSPSKRAIEVVEGLYLLELEIPSKFRGKKINNLDIRNKYQVDIVLVKKPEDSGKPATKVPGGEYVFENNDIILILGEKDKVDFLSQL